MLQHDPTSPDDTQVSYKTWKYAYKGPLSMNEHDQIENQTEISVKHIRSRKVENLLRKVWKLEPLKNCIAWMHEAIPWCEDTVFEDTPKRPSTGLEELDTIIVFKIFYGVFGEGTRLAMPKTICAPDSSSLKPGSGATEGVLD
ncbi:hypothetical protein CFC21_099745 [Triticum aestivum]|uniref:Uncharacterized protein n=1 Tax=Triticum aestivum TaxID=4565 RepID=A0A9R1LZH3_WHEAT|nr:hypothetical protein CFC21_099745 [Triticum aestivum]